MNKHSCTEVELDLPYPPVSVSAPDPRYALILAELYAGRGSELTAVAQYSYQTIILEEENAAAAALTECISIVEMHHFHILGELILLLGSEPKLYAPVTGMPAAPVNMRRGMRNGNAQTGVYPRRYVWWSGDNISYARDLTPMLRGNIAAERMAIAEYEAAIRNIHDDSITAMLKRIILDEERHIEIFEKML